MYLLQGPSIDHIAQEDPHLVIVTLRDNKDDIRFLLYSYYTTITWWGVLLTYSYMDPSAKLSRERLGQRGLKVEDM